MKRLLSAALAVGLSVGLSSHVHGQTSITLARARAIALAHVSNNQGVTSSKLKHKDGIDVYEFDIETPGPGHQEVRIDARNGDVISSSHEDDIVGKAKEKAENAADKAAHAADKAAKSAEKTVDKVFSKDEVEKMHPAISEQRARRIAQDVYAGAPVKDIDLETKHGVLVWEVDIDTPGAGHEEVLVDANTGDVLRKKHQLDFLSRTAGQIKK